MNTNVQTDAVTENSVISEKTTAIKPEAAIIATVREEQKYTLMILSVLHEQLAEFDVGKTPDYSLMLEVMGHASDFPARFNHDIKAEFIQRIIDSSEDGHIPLENLLAEQVQLVELAKEVISALKGLLKEQTILKEEQLKIFSKNYVELLESHIEIENSYILETNLSVSDEDLQKLSEKLQQNNDPTLTTLVEERYKELSENLNRSIDDLEEAATDFAFTELMNMGAFFDAIEPFSIGIYEISAIIKDYSYRMYLDNYHCYKELLTTKQDEPRAYLKRPVECMMESYKESINSLNKIKGIVEKTRKEIKEPYEVRRKIFRKYRSKN